jgi:F-type H+-transporting ATPase subunit delta
LLEVALTEHADPSRIESELIDFAAMLRDHRELEKVLVNPAVPTPRKLAAVVEILKHTHYLPQVTKLFKLLATRDRLVLLPDLVAAYQDRLMDLKKVVRAEVTTAVPLASDRAKTIEQSLARVTGRTVLLTTKVDPSIIGGIVARVGGTVYDASVTTHLQRLKERLLPEGRS